VILKRFVRNLFFFALIFTFGQSSFAQAETVKPRVLLVGDSQSIGPFGRRLDQLLRQDFTVETHAVVGSILKWWRTGQVGMNGLLSISENGKITETKTGPTPNLENLLNQFRPDWIILQFGGNYRGFSAAEIRADIETSLKHVEAMGARCFFVSNPASRFPVEGLPEALEAAVKSRCEFFRSDLVTEYPSMGGDGYHYSFKAGIPVARAWAKQVYTRFLERLAR